MLNNHYIKKLYALNDQYADRKIFHEKAAELLPEIGRDKQFWPEVFRKNLSDKGYLQRVWTMYEIPFFYVSETDDFNLKVHLFVPLKTHEPHIAASAIHHHNNYILTTFATFGSGYEAFLFEKDFTVNEKTKEAKLKIKEHFTQQERAVHTIEAWEPHVVINPVSMSATLNLWSPDKKRVTDNLRSNPILKTFKIPLRRFIYTLGLDKTIGIAAQNTYQFYTKEGKFYGVLEDEFFAPTRAQKGEEVNNYSVQTIFRFMQLMKFDDFNFIASLKSNVDVPQYYHKWIDKFLDKEEIPETYAKAQINIPGGRMTADDIIHASNNSINRCL